MNDRLTPLPFAKTLTLSAALLLVGCGSPPPDAGTTYKINLPCGDKPNCVSSLDTRDDYLLPPFQLSSKGLAHWPEIQYLALQLPGSKLAAASKDYFRLECTSTVFRFVDDFEVRKKGAELIVRSESRVGYSDFGVNRDRAELFRQLLNHHGFIAQEPQN